MYRIEADVHFSRRKRLHWIFDERDQAQWSGKTITGALAWLMENGHQRALLLGDDQAFTIDFTPAMKPR